jgi:hypothetical protein
MSERTSFHAKNCLKLLHLSLFAPTANGQEPRFLTPKSFQNREKEVRKKTLGVQVHRRLQRNKKEISKSREKWHAICN